MTPALVVRNLAEDAPCDHVIPDASSSLSKETVREYVALGVNVLDLIGLDELHWVLITWLGTGDGKLPSQITLGHWDGHWDGETWDVKSGADRSMVPIVTSEPPFAIEWAS